MELTFLFLFLWFCSDPVLSFLIQRKHRYNPQPKTWEEAQQFCAEIYRGNLTTVETDTDLTYWYLKQFYAWVGLRKVNGTWDSVTSSSAPFFTIAENNNTGEDCGQFKFSWRFSFWAFAENCGQKQFVICEDDNREYFFPESMTWDAGLTFCESKSMRYMEAQSTSWWGLYRSRPILKQAQDFPVWIGLNHKDPVQNPDPGSDLCLTVSSHSKTMSKKTCSESYPFLCEQNNPMLLKEELTWEDALKTCRDMNTYTQTSFDLPSVEEHELDDVIRYIRGATISKVWLGLRFLGGSWFWSNNVTDVSSLPSFNSSCPGFHLGCGALVIDTASPSDAVIEATDCSEKLNVFCYDSSPE